VTFRDQFGNDIKTEYDFLHLVPPQRAPEQFKNIAAENSFIDVN